MAKLPQTLMDIPAYKAAADKLEQIKKQIGPAEQRLAKLTNGVPSQPSIARRAAALLSGGTAAVAEATVTDAEIEQAQGELDVVREAVQQQTKHLESVTPEAVKAFCEAHVPLHKQKLEAVCASLEAAVAAVDDCDELLNSIRRQIAGHSMVAIHPNKPEMFFLQRLNHVAKDFRRICAGYLSK